MNASLSLLGVRGAAATGVVAGVALVVAGASVRSLVAVRAASAIAGRLVGSRDRSQAHDATRATSASAAPAWFIRRLEVLGVTSEPRPWWRATLVAAVAVPSAALALGGPAVGLLAAVCLIAAGAATLDLGRHRADRLVDGELPAVLDAVANGLRSGRSLAGALEEAAGAARGPARRDVARAAVVASERGAQAALAGWRERRPTPGVRLTVAALSLVAELGGPAQPIDGVATTLRDRLALELEVRTLSAQARASAVVIIASPVVFLALMAAGDATFLSFFVESPLGFGCLGAGVVTDGIGAWWMLRIVRRAS